VNSYRKLADLCDDLTDFFLGREPASYIGKDASTKPTIIISDDGTYVEVVWAAWNDLTTREERDDIVVEAYCEAFGQEKCLKLHAAVGLMLKNGNTF
jgi:hypothetical protein